MSDQREMNPGDDQFLRETIHNLQAQRLGDAARLLDPAGSTGLNATSTVHDLRLPAEFVRRAADRALRRSYEQQFPRVVGAIVRGAPPRTGDPAGTPREALAGGRRLIIAPPNPEQGSGIAPGAEPASFLAGTESGEHQPTMVRLQLPRGDHYLGAGDGGGVTIALGLLEALPGAAFAVAVRREHLSPLHNLLTTGARGGHGEITLLPVPDEVSQWAQDNGKAGAAVLADGRHIRATLIPRAATRREDISERVPGDDMATAALAGVGLPGECTHALLRSSLLFQGGNLLVVRVPAACAAGAAGERVALLSEAEVCRNLPALGSAERVIQRFRAELAVDRVEVLPAVSHHLDYELSVRALEGADGRGGRLLAFVNDDLPAARRVIAAARAITGTERPVGERARRLSAGPHDPWQGNAAILGLAHDVLEASGGSGSRAGPPVGSPRRAYLDSLARLLADRAVLHARLRRLGFEVVPIPSLAMGGDGDGAAGLNAVNALQTRTAVLIPAHGGCFTEIDRVASQAVRTGIPAETAVVAVPSLESQRRNGALHCSASLYG